MKKLVFKYFDTFCYGELIPDEKDAGWIKPVVDCQSFGYSVDAKIVFFNVGLQEEVQHIFCVGRIEFRELLGEWFQDKYDLPVRNVL
jgi:hypothetical protein